MVYNKEQISEAVEIYEAINAAKVAKQKFVEVDKIDFDRNMKNLAALGYKVYCVGDKVKIEF